jgi:hypothetical protein
MTNSLLDPSEAKHSQPHTFICAKGQAIWALRKHESLILLQETEVITSNSLVANPKWSHAWGHQSLLTNDRNLAAPDTLTRRLHHPSDTPR